MTELDWTATIVVSQHARRRALERLGWDDPQAIRAEVRCAILEGRVGERLPAWTRRTGVPGRRHEGFRYAWDADESRCWVLALGVSSVHVRTLYLDRRVEPRPDDERHLRQGFVRR